MIFKKITIYIVMAVLCFFFKAGAQEPIKPLKVGDKLPEGFWKQEHTIYQNGKTTKQTLAQYKGKLLIIDFWATWCGSCIKKFSHLDSLQQVYPKDLAMVLVSSKKTGDNLSKVKQTLDRYAEKTPLSLISIYDDEYLKTMFPHFLVSHFVWINAEGQVMAFSWSDLVNKESIALAIDPHQ